MNERFHNLAGLVRIWADARNITNGSTAKDQFVKLVSEVGEMNAASLLADGLALFKDAVGDIAVMLVIVSHQSSSRVAPSTDMDEAVHLLKSSVAGLVISTPIEMSMALAVFHAAFGNLADALAKNQPIFTHVQHCFDALAIVAGGIAATSVTECLEGSYNEIKDRKGVMFNGTFVKEADPSYQDVLSQLAAQKATR